MVLVHCPFIYTPYCVAHIMPYVFLLSIHELYLVHTLFVYSGHSDQSGPYLL